MSSEDGPDRSAEETEETDEAEDTETVQESEAEPESEDVDPSSISRIETIRVDPEKVVHAIAYNGQEDIGRKGKAVFSLAPPFDETVEPTIHHLAEDSTEGKAEGEIHLRPFRFVAEGRRIVDQRPTRKLAQKELEAEDPDEAAIEAWIDEAMETWKGHVREGLIESVDIFSPHGMAIVDVEYASEDGS